MQIRVSVGGHDFTGTLNDSRTAAQLAQRLPLSVQMSRWGDEYYGDCGVEGDPADPQRREMHIGELAVWPPGRALCLLFGPTPASSGEQPVLASPGICVGTLIGDLAALGKLGGSVQVAVEAQD